MVGKSPNNRNDSLEPYLAHGLLTSHFPCNLLLFHLPKIKSLCQDTKSVISVDLGSAPQQDAVQHQFIYIGSLTAGHILLTVLVVMYFEVFTKKKVFFFWPSVAFADWNVFCSYEHSWWPVYFFFPFQLWKTSSWAYQGQCEVGAFAFSLTHFTHTSDSKQLHTVWTSF